MSPEAAQSESLLSGLTRRADFLAAARAGRASTPAFTLQARLRKPGEADPHTVRVGFTCSKKVGNAVARNRAKRRLRALAREIMPGNACPGWDYVLIGRKGITAAHPFATMQSDLTRALNKVHTAGARRPSDLNHSQNTQSSGAQPRQTAP